MNLIIHWWDALNLELQFFYGIAIVSTIILLLQSILMVFGLGDADGAIEVDLDTNVAHHGDGLGILSVRTIIAFLTGFGWTGVICLKSGFPLITTVATALLAGGALMMSVYFVMRLFFALRQSGTLNFETAIGEIGTVYLPIPPGRKSPGKIEVMIQGRLMVVDAFTSASERLANQSKVKVIATVGTNSLLVEPLNLTSDHTQTT